MDGVWRGGDAGGPIGEGELDITAPTRTSRIGAVGTAHTKNSSRASGTRRTGCHRSRVQRERQAADRPAADRPDPGAGSAAVGPVAAPRVCDPGARLSRRYGSEIARLRVRCRLSQAELASRAGMSPPNLSRIENSLGQNLTLGTLVRLARAMDRDVAIRFGRRRDVAVAAR